MVAFNTSSVVWVIPAYNPDAKLVSLVASIREKDTDIPLLVVDDGSGFETQEIFDVLESKYHCIVVHHAVNMGKGRALKTALNEVLLRFPHVLGVVTLDADGQHVYEDVISTLQQFIENPDALVLGVRTFHKDIPWKSRFGNIITRNVLKILTGLKLTDTQTGLRVIPRAFMKELLVEKGERYEFEMRMLVSAKQKRVAIVESPIQTIYIDDNASSHFRALVDSATIYAVFLKYLISAILSSGIDILAFTVILAVQGYRNPSTIMLATIVARIISSYTNYTINKNTVFESDSKNAILRYYTLAAIQMLLSGLLVAGVSSILQSLNVTFIKVCVDGILFFMSFQVQRIWVFR